MHLRPGCLPLLILSPASQSFKECGDSLDSDGDGIPDSEDKCPHNTPEEISKGVYQEGPNKGCPIDTDNDGVPDYRDDCPNNTPLEISKGVDSRGCPLDSDQDGVPDYRDLCPGTPLGVQVDENGCAQYQEPIKQVLAGDVTFAFDKFDLTPQAKTNLDGLVEQIDLAVLESISVVGHTDSVGTEQYNHSLSEKRAAAVAQYLISRGIPSDRIGSVGKGELEPIEDNTTKIGRARNRRVEITINHYKKK